MGGFLDGIFVALILANAAEKVVGLTGTLYGGVASGLYAIEFVFNPRVRAILARHGWFQTVLSDLPHFTYLGLAEDELPQHGLKRVVVNGQTFWIPNVDRA